MRRNDLSPIWLAKTTRYDCTVPEINSCFLLGFSSCSEKVDLFDWFVWLAVVFFTDYYVIVGVFLTIGYSFFYQLWLVCC